MRIEFELERHELSWLMDVVSAAVDEEQRRGSQRFGKNGLFYTIQYQESNRERCLRRLYKCLKEAFWGKEFEW